MNDTEFYMAIRELVDTDNTERANSLIQILTEERLKHISHDITAFIISAKQLCMGLGKNLFVRWCMICKKFICANIDDPLLVTNGLSDGICSDECDKVNREIAYGDRDKDDIPF